MDTVPDESLALFFDEILAAPTTAELLVGMYAHAMDALRSALGAHIVQTNPLTDYPSVRVCRFAHFEVCEMSRYGESAVGALSGARPCNAEWRDLLARALWAAGGIAGDERGPRVDADAVPPRRIEWSGTPPAAEPA